MMLRWLEHSDSDIWEFLTNIALSGAERGAVGSGLLHALFWPQNLGLCVHIHNVYICPHTGF